MHALRKIHRALVPGGVLLDIHPVPPAEEVEAEGRALGRLDARGFFADVAEAERLLAESGLFRLDDEIETDVVERFDGVEEAIESVAERRRMRMRPELVERVRLARPPIDLRERVVFRRFRAS